MTNPELHALFAKYNTPLKLLFGFLTKLEDPLIDRILMFETIQFRTFIKFCLFYALIPFIISTEEAVIIFRTITKPPKKPSSEEDLKAAYHLNFEQFQEALVKIAAYGKAAIIADIRNPKPNKKASPDINMDGMTVGLIEKLFKYMQLSEDDDKRSLQAKFEEIKEVNLKQRKVPMKKPKESLLEVANDIVVSHNKKKEESKVKQTPKKSVEKKEYPDDSKKEHGIVKEEKKEDSPIYDPLAAPK